MFERVLNVPLTQLKNCKNCIDLVAAEAEYRRQCRQNFYSNRSKPIRSKSDKKNAGRHKYEDLHNSFIQLCVWLEQPAEAFTMKELEENMKMLRESGESYSYKRIGQKLKEYYQDLVYFVCEPGIVIKVFFTDMANSILSDAWYEERKDKI